MSDDRIDISQPPGPASPAGLEPLSFPGPLGGGEPPRRRPRVKKLRLASILLGLSLLALVSTVFGMMMAVASDIPQLENRAEFRAAKNSVLYDIYGRPLGILTSRENRILLRDDQIAPVVKHAVIAIEDRRFYVNPGVDLRGIARAFFQDVVQKKAVQGGSTITQQFVKNALRAQRRRTVFQKLREAATAYHLTRKWSKQKILTEYLNAIYFGNGAYGIESAARTYFGSDPNHAGCGTQTRPCAGELKPHEAALLAGLIASPTGFDPVAHPAASLARRNVVLDKMREEGYLSPAEHAQAVAEPLPAASAVQPPREKSITPSTAYFTSWVKQQVVDRFTARTAFSGGLRIRTTLDLDLQRAAEQAVQNRLGDPFGPTSALVVIDNRTAEVRAMVGGRNYNDRPFNLATQGQRQPGSAFKPFVLAAALRSGISPTSVWTSRRKEFTVPGSGGKEKFVVNNYDDAYSGVTTLARATASSDNSVYAEVGIKVGVAKIARLAHRMGIRTPVSRNYALTLGGLRQGVTPLDMAHAFETLARGGNRVTGSLGAPDSGPVGIREVCTKPGDRGRLCDPDNTLARNRTELERVLPARVARTATAILEGVVRFGTAKRAAIGGFAAGKTGTTEDYGDAWFVGFNERYTVAVWVGYPDELRAMKTEYHGEPVAGGTFPAEIWRDFMLAARRIDELRAARRAAKEGGDATTVPVTPPPATTGPSGSTTAPPADAAPREQATTPTSPSQDNRGGNGGGAKKPAAPREPTPMPAPAPTPAPAPAPSQPPQPTPESGGVAPGDHR